MVLKLILLLILMSAPPLIGQESPRQSNRDFWALSAVSAGAVIADMEVTKYKERTMRGFIELNPCLGFHPSRPRMYAMNLGTQVGVNLLAWRLRRQGHRRLWKAVFVASIALNAWCIQRNLRLREYPGWKAVPR